MHGACTGYAHRMHGKMVFGGRLTAGGGRRGRGEDRVEGGGAGGVSGPGATRGVRGMEIGQVVPLPKRAQGCLCAKCGHCDPQYRGGSGLAPHELGKQRHRKIQIAMVRAIDHPFGNDVGSGGAERA